MEINEVVGINIKQMRNDKSLSLDDLSELTGVSKSMLGQIERGESSPSINVLWKITNGLKIDFSKIISQEEPEIEIVKQKKPKVYDNGKCKIHKVFSFSNKRNFETYNVELESQGHYKASKHVKGSEEYIFVYQGSLTIRIEGKDHFVNSGQSIRFHSDQSHEYLNETLIATKFTIQIIYN